MKVPAVHLRKNASFVLQYCLFRKYGRVKNVLIKNGKFGFAEFDDHRYHICFKFNVLDPTVTFNTSLDPRTRTTGLWNRILLFSSVVLKMPTQNRVSFFFQVFLLFTLHLHQSSKKRVIKKSQIFRNTCFFKFFCLLVEGSRAGSGSVQIIRDL